MNTKPSKSNRTDKAVLLRLPPYPEIVEIKPEDYSKFPSNFKVDTKLCYASGFPSEVLSLPTHSTERWAGFNTSLICSVSQRDILQSLIKEEINTLYVKVDSYSLHPDCLILYPLKGLDSIRKATHQWQESFTPIYEPQESLASGEMYIVYYANPNKGFEKEPILCSKSMSLESVVSTIKRCYPSSLNSRCIYINRVDREGEVELYSYPKQLILKR